MKVDDFLIYEFSKAYLPAEEIKILESNPGSFGDFVSTVRSGNKLVYVIRDRGQTFIRVFALNSGKYMRNENLLNEIYESGNWELSDLLSVIRGDNSDG